MRLSELKWKSVIFGGRFYGVKGLEYEKNVLDVLRLKRPTLDNLVYLAYVFSRSGFSEQEACEYVHKLNCWEQMPSGGKYDKTITETIIGERYYYDSKGSREKPNHTHSKKASRHLPPLYETLLELSKCVIPKFGIKGMGCKQVAVFYYNQGYTPLPKHPDGKYPGGKSLNEKWYMMEWKKYQTIRPTMSQILSWDWSHGVCLLGGDVLFMIDVDGKKGKRGIENIMQFKDLMLNENHWEITQSQQGVHIFAKDSNGERFRGLDYGNEGIEIIGKGSLIVAYPTPGYTLGVGI